MLGILPPRCQRPRDAANPKNPGGPVPDWYTGRVSHQTRQLLREDGGFLYDSDAYNDDLPYWLFEGTPGEVPHLVVPYTLVNNDARYLLPNGFATGDDFGSHLRDAFDLLWEEGAQAPKLMSVGLHARISGHPARAMALARFLDHVRNRERIWVCRREDVARHWLSVPRPRRVLRARSFPVAAPATRPLATGRDRLR